MLPDVNLCSKFSRSNYIICVGHFFLHQLKQQSEGQLVDIKVFLMAVA